MRGSNINGGKQTGSVCTVRRSERDHADLPKHRPYAFTLALCLFCQLFLSAAHGQLQFAAIKLFPKLTYSQAFGINSRGEVVGVYSFGSGIFIWHAGVSRDAGPANAKPNLGYYPFWIDNCGLIAGHVEGAQAYGFVLFRKHLIQISGDYSWPNGMNQRGHVVGYGNEGTWIWRCFKKTIIPTPYPQFFYPTGINDRDEVVGRGFSSNGDHMYLYTGGQLQDLGQPFGGTTYPVAINDKGEITGFGRNNSGGSHGFIYANGMTRIIDGPGFFTSNPIAMNNLGQIAGTFIPTSTYQGPLLAFYYDGAQMHDLTALLPPDINFTPTAINDAGQISGTGIRDGVYSAYLLNPVR